MTIPVWYIPTGLTVVLWLLVFCAPLPDQRGDYDFGPALSMMARLAGGIIGTLSFWLVYFAWRAT